jgi:hypothetical protein
LIVNACFEGNGLVYFQLVDELGQTQMTQQLVEGQNFSRYGTEGLISGLYYWRLKDSARTIKAGKIIIMK